MLNRTMKCGNGTAESEMARNSSEQNDTVTVSKIFVQLKKYSRLVKQSNLIGTRAEFHPAV